MAAASGLLQKATAAVPKEPEPTRPPPDEPRVMNRCLAVCRWCWREHYPEREPPAEAVLQHHECVVCEQARGVYWVRMRLEWPR